jgi:hypothetical protein
MGERPAVKWKAMVGSRPMIIRDEDIQCRSAAVPDIFGEGWKGRGGSNGYFVVTPSFESASRGALRHFLNPATTSATEPGSSSQNEHGQLIAERISFHRGLSRPKLASLSTADAASWSDVTFRPGAEEYPSTSRPSLDFPMGRDAPWSELMNTHQTAQR